MGDETDQQFRDWMRGNLTRAAEHFGLVIQGAPRWGWRLRSISAPASNSDGPCWLRVGSEQQQWLTEADVADFWTGIPDSNVIVGIPKPQVLASVEWPAAERGRMVRADVMTMMAGRSCSSNDVLRTAPDLSDSWWTELRHSIDVVRSTPTTRYATRTSPANSRVRRVFGSRVAEDMQPTAWETCHGDLHWSNVLHPQCGLLDWELWGPGPVGADAATLFLFSLLVPEVAGKVAEVFADLLDSRAGRIAQVSVASRILHQAADGEYPDLAPVVRRQIEPMLH